MKNKVNVMKRIIIQAQKHYILVHVLKKKNMESTILMKTRL